jgi:hypothetical protein
VNKNDAGFALQGHNGWRHEGCRYVSRLSGIRSGLRGQRPGLTLFHCHQQLHMDFGFMTLYGELLGLQSKDIDWDAKRITFGKSFWTGRLQDSTKIGQEHVRHMPGSLDRMLV